MRRDVAVLFSGGIDSVVHLQWAVNTFGREAVRAVYFDVGQAYAGREVPRARQIAQGMRVTFEYVAPMRLHEDATTAQIEFRNAFLILWAATLFEADGVVFGMLQGEAPPDKTPRFVRGLQRIIRDCRRGSIYAGRRQFDIHVPFSRHTKSEMLRWYLRDYGCTDAVRQSVGCFGAQEPMCGACWSCFNRWLAWRENGLPDEEYARHPADWLLEKLQRMRQDRTDRQWFGLRNAWERRRWLAECWRQVDRHARETMGRRALSVALRPA